MSCFWRDFLQCADPACFSGTEIFAEPQGGTGNYIPALFSDKALTLPIFPAQASVLAVSIFSDTGLGSCLNGCNAYQWAHGGNAGAGCFNYTGIPWGDPLRMPDDPPLATTVEVFSANPALVFPPASGFNPGSSIPGFATAIGASLCPVAVFVIGSDVGTVVFVVVLDCCH